jgi:ketosteroid isomerase-like protein
MNEEEEVLKVNHRFYQALSDLDLEAMERIWLHEVWVSCIHPGWQMLRGWENVRESWRRIFTGTFSHRIDIGQISVQIHGEVAWVTCLERISTPTEDGGDYTFAACTNLFVSTLSGWKMILHHASSVPVEEPTPPGMQVH